jgi:uncharacterized protein (DUF2147 family)
VKDENKPIGFVIIDNLKYNVKSKKWEGGKIHVPNSSRNYTAEVKVTTDGNLVVKGYKGVRIISSLRTFKRVK